ncbi:MAG: pilus assembly protein PilM [Planctomycetota bacterium]
MARATGVQISGSAVRIVDLEGSGKKFKIRGFGESAIAPDVERGPALAKAVKDAFKTAKASREHVILGIPTRDCIIREITIPFSNPDQIKKVIKFESESHLHSCSIDEVVICFKKVVDLGNRSTVLVFAARKTVIQEALSALESFGIDPLAIDLDSSGLFCLMKAMPQIAERKNYVVCEIGYTSTLIMLVQDGDLRIVRSVRMGTDSILSRVSKDLDIGRDEAKTRTQEILREDLSLDDDLFVQRGDVEDLGRETGKTAGELERDIIRQRQAELLVRLKQEIYRSLNPAKLEEPIEAIFLTGPGSTLPRIRKELSEAMELKVETLDVLDFMSHKFASSETEVFNSVIPVAAGMAIKFAGEDALGLDFRQEEFVFAKKFDRLKVPLFCLAILFTALNALWFYKEKQEAVGRESSISAIAQRADEYFRKVMDPKKLKRGALEKYPYDKAKLQRTYLGSSSSMKGMARLRYMNREIKDIHSELRKVYGLNEGGRTRSRRGGRPGGNRKKAAQGINDFVSALERAEQVLNAVYETGVRDISLNQFKATPVEVRFALTVPKQTSSSDGTTKTFDQIVGMLIANLEALPKEARFKEFDDRQPYVPGADDRGIDYPLLVAVFEKEAR